MMICNGSSGRACSTVKYDRAAAVAPPSSTSTTRLVITCFVHDEARADEGGHQDQRPVEKRQKEKRATEAANQQREPKIPPGVQHDGREQLCPDVSARNEAGDADHELFHPDRQCRPGDTAQ